MRTITKNLYTFGEMIEGHKAGRIKTEAVERARQWMIEGFQCFEWYDFIYAEWEAALSQIGFIGPEISFSGFSCQGDGASFECKSVDMEKLIAFMSSDIQPSNVVAGEPGDWRPWLVWKADGKTPANLKYRRIPLDNISAKVERISHRYSHENTCAFRVEGYDSRHVRIEKLVDSFERDVEHLRRDLCRAIYKDLEESYYAQTSDDELIDSAEANEYTFDATGRREG